MDRLDPTIVDYGKAHKKAYSAIYRAVKRYDKIVCFRHIRPDFDAFGSQMGIYTFLKDNFPEKEIHYVGDNHVTFTGKIYPETETLPESWFENNKFLAIITDVGEHKRIADPRYRKAKYKIKVDHHPSEKEIAPRATVLDLSAGSASELVADILLNWKGTFLSKEAASYLYSGIVGDTGRFMFPSTSPHTMAIGTALLGKGIDISDIYKKMYEKSINSLYGQAYVLSNFKVSEHGVAYYLLPKEKQDELHITPELGKEHVNMLSNIKEISIWCSITEDPNPKDYCWRISIRSKKGVDVSGVAKRWGGGGHAQASGARIDSLEQLEEFVQSLDEILVK